MSPASVARMVSVGESAVVGPADFSAVLARPKSRTFTTPSGVTMTLPGFRSRWMMPLSWAASSASAICRAMFNASFNGSGPLGFWPSINSMTMAFSSRPKMVAMFGWCSAARACASRWKRAR